MRIDFNPEIWLVTRQEFNPEEWLNPTNKERHTPTVPVEKKGNHEHDIEVIVRRIESYQIDLTLNYQNWLTICFALCELGESGRNYFHRVSAFHADYNRDKCNHQFDECLKGRRSGISIKTFYYLAQQAGINIRV